MAVPRVTTDVDTPFDDRSYGVVIADDDERVRTALADLIGDHPRLRLLAEAVDGYAAAELCARHDAQLAVIDVRMPHGGSEAIAAIRDASPTTLVAAYTSLGDRRTRDRLIESGATAVFVKGRVDDLGDELAGLIHH